MDNHRKLTVAKVLENTNRFMNEAFDNSVATQRSDMGLWKKFCLNLTTVALPNLIAEELVIVHPMSSMSGYITYINYVAGTKKGKTNQGDLFNNPFQLGDVDKDYTGEAVAEVLTATQTTSVAWTPVVKKVFEKGDIKLIKKNNAGTLYGTFAQDAEKTGSLTGMTFVDEDGVTQTYTPAAGDKIAYKYDNIVIPQNDLPILNAKMESIPLIAKARRIAVYYSQIAAYQAKTDYGFDLGDQLAEKAVGQLQYEIDTEIVSLLDETAGAAQAELTWSKTLPVGVNKKDHYMGFAEMVEIARQKIYDATKRFAPNYMVIASNILPVLSLMDGFKPAPSGQINGPYLAGTLNSLKVFVSPAIAPGKYLIGVNGNDYMSSVAVYAPYMAIVPTQLLQYADGGTSQGWSTLYDLKVLNPNLIVAGAVTE